MDFVNQLSGLASGADSSTADMFTGIVNGAVAGKEPDEVLKDVDNVETGATPEETVEKTANSSKAREAMASLKKKIMGDKSLTELWNTAKANMNKWFGKIIAVMKKHLTPKVVAIAVAVLLMGTVICLYTLKKRKKGATTESLVEGMTAFTEAEQSTEEQKIRARLMPYGVLMIITGIVGFFLKKPLLAIAGIAGGILLIWAGPKVAVKSLKSRKGSVAEAKPDDREFTEEDIRHYDNEFKKYYEQSISKHVNLNYLVQLHVPEDIEKKLKAKFPHETAYEPEELPIKSVGRKKWFEEHIRKLGYKPYSNDVNLLSMQYMDLLKTKASKKALEILKPYTAKDKMKRWKELYDNEPYRTYEKL